MSASTPTSQPGFACEGWWQQQYYGRQAMHQLRLAFDGGQIAGSGIDVIGPFTFTGTLSSGGHVTMIKQYLGQHAVEYLGQYDGEGVLFGHWRIGKLSDRWMIRINRPRAAPADATIAEVVA